MNHVHSPECLLPDLHNKGSQLAKQAVQIYRGRRHSAFSGVGIFFHRCPTFSILVIRSFLHDLAILENDNP